MFAGFSYVMLYTPSVDQAVLWYVNHLDFTVERHITGEYAVLVHEKAGRLALHASRGAGGIGCGPVPYFAVDDIDAAVRMLEQMGVEVNPPRQEGSGPRFTQFRDGDGNIIGMEEHFAHQFAI
ncbi:MAG: hypothetical protein AMXMBFR84_23290 [Candidatus Hydrogenedentota bacterium]